MMYCLPGLAIFDGIKIEQFDQRDPQSGTLNHLLIEDRQSRPGRNGDGPYGCEGVVGHVSRQQRRIAKALALGETTNVVARKFGFSPARISQLRLWFRAALGAVSSRDEGCRMCGLKELNIV